ncbi:MAG: hypothetical protein M9924_04920 [Rhizobiaceae bacterium]|nr:hypothetical protein [Rhizobiaceae bacterium]
MNASADFGCYFERAPEKLVLEGYRRWMAGFETGSVTPWETAWGVYAEVLGPTEARRALAELSYFVRTLRHCAACPLRSFPFGARHICRDECVTLGLIAGLQHGDSRAADRCLEAIACPALADMVCEAASGFAHVLSDCEQHLLPIPLAAIEDVLSRAGRATIH